MTTELVFFINILVGQNIVGQVMNSPGKSARHQNVIFQMRSRKKEGKICFVLHTQIPMDANKQNREGLIQLKSIQASALF